MVNTVNRGSPQAKSCAAEQEPLISTVELKEVKKDTTNDTDKKLTLGEIKKAIPAKVFEKSLLKSVFHMILDYALWGASFYAFYSLVNSQYWPEMQFYQQAIATVLYWNASGLFMWCQFVVGHDCGHGNFSNYEIVNDILGHISHGSLLVPYWPWQLSHRRHHMHHNHVHNDYSYYWMTDDKMNQKGLEAAQTMEKLPVVKFFIPFFVWFTYLLGFGDGCHLFPIPTQRLWESTATSEKVKCLVSTAVVVAYGYLQYQLCEGSLSTWAFYYGGSLVMMAWWLVTVTYLQHHSPDTLVYDDHDWTFVRAGLETVDRKYGFGIDAVTHHITDCHVAHHLFYTQIPHYNLPQATSAIKKYLADQNLMHLYKYENTMDFMTRAHHYLVSHGFRATRADPHNYPGANSASNKKQM